MDSTASGRRSAGPSDVHALHVLDSRFIGGRRTPVYIGNQRGTITVDDFRFERNVIDGSEITGGGIGYGIQLKLNVDGVVRDNFVRGTMGPGIMVYGFEDPDTEYRQLVERNIVVGSRNNPNIIVGGGPATARHNLALGSRSGGISVINYGGRGYVHHVTVTENISAANRGTDLNVHSTATYLVATGNRVYTAPDRPGIGNLPTDGNEVAGNHEAPANDALLEVIAQLRDTVPCNDSVRQATQSLEGGVPANQTELVKLLQTLLGS